MSFRNTLIMVFLLSFNFGFSQNSRHKSQSYFVEVVQGDTIKSPLLPEVRITASKVDYYNKLARYRRYVQRTIALADFVASIHKDFNDSLANLTRSKSRKAFLKAERKKLFNEFTGVISTMNLHEGKVFMKLVCRQSGGYSTYDIIKEFQGGFKAVLWQTLSRTGGANLKLTYDPSYEDKMIEDIMKEISVGKLKAHPLPRSKEQFLAQRKY